MRPQLRKPRTRLAADIYVHVSFSNRGVRIGNCCDELRIREQILQLIGTLTEKNHARPRVRARPPEAIAVVAADGSGQAQARSKVVDRSRLAVIARQDCAA